MNTKINAADAGQYIEVWKQGPAANQCTLMPKPPLEAKINALAGGQYIDFL